MSARVFCDYVYDQAVIDLLERLVLMKLVYHMDYETTMSQNIEKDAAKENLASKAANRISCFLLP